MVHRDANLTLLPLDHYWRAPDNATLFFECVGSPEQGGTVQACLGVTRLHGAACAERPRTEYCAAARVALHAAAAVEAPSRRDRRALSAGAAAGPSVVWLEIDPGDASVSAIRAVGDATAVANAAGELDEDALRPGTQLLLCKRTGCLTAQVHPNATVDDSPCTAQEQAAAQSGPLELVLRPCRVPLLRPPGSGPEWALILSPQMGLYNRSDHGGDGAPSAAGGGAREVDASVEVWLKRERCSNGHTGNLCAGCLDGFSASAVGKPCDRCPEACVGCGGVATESALWRVACGGTADGAAPV